jgi:hypothetical protein
MMPAQEETSDSAPYDSDESDESVATSVGCPSVDSEPLVAKRPAKTVAEKSGAQTAVQVRFIRAARSDDPFLRAMCGVSCSLHSGESSVQ